MLVVIENCASDSSEAFLFLRRLLLRINNLGTYFTPIPRRIG
jgi:hypothetical protein